jgi:MATE family multidrug resistance protein
MNALLKRHASSRRVERRRASVREVLAELKALLLVAGPVMLTNVATFGAGLTDAAFVGHLPAEACTLGGQPTQYLAGVGLAHTLMVIVYFLSKGMNFAMDTLVSQNFGRGNLERCSELLQTGLFVGAVAALPVAVLWFFTSNLLALVFDLDDVTLAVARTFSRLLIISLPGLLVFDVLAKWNSNMQVIRPQVVCSAFTLILNALLNWLLIYGVGLGYVGSPIATVITRTVLPVVFLGWLKLRGHLKRSWFGWSRRAFGWVRVREYVRYGAPAGGMIILEVMSYHGMTVLTGFLHDEAIVASQVAANNLLLICYFVPLGIAVATAARTGARVGAGDAEGARFVALVAQALAVALALLTSLVIVAARDALSYMFTDSADVARLSAKVFVIVAFVHCFDAFQGVGLAVVRGIGRQNVGFWLNLVAYYVVGLPLGSALMFGAHMGVFGVWTGYAIALAVLACMVVVYNFTIDFQHECHLAALNAEKARADDAAAAGAGDDELPLRDNDAGQTAAAVALGDAVAVERDYDTAALL